MTETSAALLVLMFAVALFGLVVLGLIIPNRVEERKAIRSTPYLPRHAMRIPGATLDPVTLALPAPLPSYWNSSDDALERIAAKLRQPDPDPADLLPVLAYEPAGQSGKLHRDWRFDSDEHQLAWDEFFSDQPSNAAVAKPWRGTGIAVR